MEYWRLTTESGLFLSSAVFHSYRNRSNSTNPNTPTLQHSKTPLIIGIESRAGDGLIALIHPRRLSAGGCGSLFLEINRDIPVAVQFCQYGIQSGRQVRFKSLQGKGPADGRNKK